MMVTFVSQCEKNALKKTRRVLDAFANRIGDNTWQTVITEDGLITVKKMLRQTASRNTAVSCHWIRSRSRSQLLWIVGNRHKFNSEGIVAVNYTKLDLEHKEWENGWELNEAIMLASSIAGLFHDFGKANDLFQQKLAGTTKSKSEPYRHEWVSLRLFEAFIKNLTDQEWLTKLVEINQQSNASQAENEIHKILFKDNGKHQNPFNSFSDNTQFGKLVAWLIVSHHRLPYPQINPVRLDEAEHWLTKCFDCHWNSKNAENLADIESSVINANWNFAHGTPLLSKTWQNKASEISKRALSYHKLSEKTDWLNQRFVSHLSRLSLMLADHYYSSLELKDSKMKWRDNSYQANANTDRKTNQLKQKLDEHNIGVAHNAFLFAKNLPALKYTLPALAQHRLFSQSAKDRKYQWQDKAFKASKEFAKTSEKHGFFGINMASTGCGKTMANARIMYALADEREGCRFSVALGLRTLTLQTGDAYRDLLKLGDDELAVLIGSNAVKLLHQLNKDDEISVKPDHGSESAQDFFEQLYVSYEGQIYDGRLKHWLKGNPKLEQLISAPILVSTIDHLMPATESKRGGKQIAPMLRLLTSDLILDEPDDFGLEDLPALCRLVNWAGMLGSRVLLSSATLPPALISALYDAYVAGRNHYNQANFPHNNNLGVVCAWFDENKSEVELIKNKEDFKQKNNRFVESRLKKLTANSKVLRKGKIVNIELPITENSDLAGQNIDEKNQQVYQCVADTIHQQIYELHNQHHVTHSSGKKVSIGVVRMANINPMISVAKILLAMSPRANYQFNFCIYHSQFPLALRSYKESRLDKTLNRYDEQAIWQQPEIAKALKADDLNKVPVDNHVFIVLGTSVVEVGRDHDYDWAIAEPSSLRSIIQLAGRIQRHRQAPPTTANLVVLNQNIRALKGEKVAYCKPGFETPELPLNSKDLNELLTTELDNISAIPRIVEPKEIKADDFKKSPKDKYIANAANLFSIQEHRSLRITLDVMGADLKHKDFYNSIKPASLWWNESPAIDWSAEFIRQTEFRKSQAQEEFILRLEEGETLAWSQIDDTRYPPVYLEQTNRFMDENKTTELAQGNHWWFHLSVEETYQIFADKLDESLQQVSETFGVIGLREPSKDQELNWHWHEQLGVFDNK
ncbi:type I-F CRISPR-associated helicase Cas3f [Alteromonas sp. M12]|uniref:type I-F CRISPR-associated helicase Cas3f n=1 Tax=Alteromonas sp. M12 TaxID=3135644 RepID=UPI00319D98D4